MVIGLDFSSSIPIYRQLRNQIVLGIGRGQFAPGDDLPSVRQMADECGINPMTVNKTYQQLKEEGWIAIDRRHGAVILEHFEGKPDVREKLQAELMLPITEAHLKGLEKEEFYQLCERIFSQLRGATQC